MGLCCCPNETGKNIPKKNIPYSEQKKIDVNLFIVIPSVCKIIVDNKVGSGFLINLKDKQYLMTNGDVVSEDAINSKKNILVYYNRERYFLEIDLNESRRHIQEFKNIKIDAIIIEILPEDKIDKNYFLHPELNTKYDLQNAKIYIPEFSSGKELNYSDGKIIKTNGIEISHNALAKPISSGCPILLENSSKVIGIHKEGNKIENIGFLLSPIINELNYPKMNTLYDSSYSNNLNKKSLENCIPINNIQSLENMIPIYPVFPVDEAVAVGKNNENIDQDFPKIVRKEKSICCCS